MWPLSGEYDQAKLRDPHIRMGARNLLEFGESREGYWTGTKFMEQMASAVKIAEAKYLKEGGYRLFWVFDQSGCHMAYAEDANRMNAKDGGCQPLMHDTIYEGKPLSMTKLARSRTGDTVRIARGMIDVLNQRGRYRPTMKVDDMRKELACHRDFRDEKNKLEYFLHNRGHACLFIPKYQCEINPIERCWYVIPGHTYTWAYRNYNIVGLCRNVSLGLDTVSTENIAKS